MRPSATGTIRFLGVGSLMGRLRELASYEVIDGFPRDAAEPPDRNAPNFSGAKQAVEKRSPTAQRFCGLGDSEHLIHVVSSSGKSSNSRHCPLTFTA